MHAHLTLAFGPTWRFTSLEDYAILLFMSITRLYRLLHLITLLRSGRRYDADALAAESGVSRRTIFRDLNILDAAGIPYYFDEQAQAYAIRQSFFLPAINLTVDEALALVLASRKMIGQMPLPLFQQASRAAVKIESSLPKAIQDHCGSILDRLDVRWPAIAEDRDLDATFHHIRTAIEGQRKIRMLYESLYDAANRDPLGKTIDTTVSPFRLVFIHRAWYLIGHSSYHGEIRTLKLSRIRKADVLEEMFAANDEFSLEAYLGDAWIMIPEGQRHRIELLFSPKVARNVAEVQWHHTQDCSFLDDGRLKFTATVDGLNEISWWILGYGDQVRVIKPTKLADMIKKTAHAVSKIYQPQNK